MKRSTKIISILVIIAMVIGIGTLILTLRNKHDDIPLDEDSMRCISLGYSINKSTTMGEIVSIPELNSSYGISKSDSKEYLITLKDEKVYTIHFRFSKNKASSDGYTNITGYINEMDVDGSAIYNTDKIENELIQLKKKYMTSKEDTEETQDDVDISSAYGGVEDYDGTENEDTTTENNDVSLDEVCSSLQNELNNSGIKCTVTHPLDINNNQTITITMRSSISKDAVDTYRNNVDHATYMKYRKALEGTITSALPASELSKIDSDIRQNLNAHLVVKVLYSGYSQFTCAIYNGGWHFILPS